MRNKSLQDVPGGFRKAVNLKAPMRSAGVRLFTLPERRGFCLSRQAELFNFRGVFTLFRVRNVIRVFKFREPSDDSIGASALRRRIFRPDISWSVFLFLFSHLEER